MERTRRLRNHILRTFLCIPGIYILSSCEMEDNLCDVTINFRNTLPEVRSAFPEEDLITNITLMVFDEKGDAEDCLWLENGQTVCSLRLVENKRYFFCACANPITSTSARLPAVTVCFLPSDSTAVR